MVRIQDVLVMNVIWVGIVGNLGLVNVEPIELWETDTTYVVIINGVFLLVFEYE